MILVSLFDLIKVVVTVGARHNIASSIRNFASIKQTSLRKFDICVRFGVVGLVLLSIVFIFKSIILIILLNRFLSFRAVSFVLTVFIIF